MKEFGGEIQLVYRSYELSPSAEAGSKDSIYEAMAKKQNISIMDAMAFYEQLGEAGAKWGLRFDGDMLIPTNTFDALRLSHYAKDFGVQYPLMKVLFKAHFSDGLDVADHQVLADLAAGVGLDREDVFRFLGSSQYREEVIGDHASAALMGITSIPYYVIDEKYGIGGAQSKEAFLEALGTASA